MSISVAITESNIGVSVSESPVSAALTETSISAAVTESNVGVSVSESTVTASITSSAISASISSSPINVTVSSSGASTAANVSIVDAGEYYIGTEVETALQEIGAAFAGLGALAVLDDLSTFSTTDLSEGTNLYYTDARVGTYGDANYLKLDTSNDPIIGPLIHRNAFNSTVAFQIQQADETPVVVVDTTNLRVGINKIPTTDFEVFGSMRFGNYPTNYSQLSGGDWIKAGANLFFRTSTNHRMTLGTNNTARYRITNTGKHIFGTTTSPVGYVFIDGLADEVQLTIQANATQTAALVQHQTSNADVHNEFFVAHASNLYTTVFNKQGSPLLDFKVLSDAYDALFIDASENSIDIMHHASGKIGFYATTPTTQQVLATGAGATVDNIISALQTLGLVKQA